MLSRENDFHLRSEWQKDMSLVHVLSEAALTPTLAIAPHVEIIRLEEFDKIAGDLLARSFSDPRGAEFNRAVYFNRNKGLAYGELVRGSDTDFGQISIIKKSNQFLNKNYRLATVVHSHGTADIPNSPPDLKPLFLPATHKFGGLLSFVITPGAKWLIFRGANIPQWSQKTVSDNINLWTVALLRQMNRFNLQHILETENQQYTSLVQAAFLSDLAKRYDLSVYWSLIGDNVAVRKNPDYLVECYRLNMTKSLAFGKRLTVY